MFKVKVGMTTHIDSKETVATEWVIPPQLENSIQFTEAITRPRHIWRWMLAGWSVYLLIGLWSEDWQFTPITFYVSLIGAAGGFVIYVFALALREFYKNIAKMSTLVKTNENLQSTLEEDFFTKLVKINFKYIDQYYLQTQSQANKGFILSMIVSILSLAMIGFGIWMMYQGKLEASKITVTAGILSEFIASVFFYLYNRTVTKMGEYHQKLVLTQNISLALKISESLPEVDRVVAQKELISRLTENVNALLIQSPTSK